MTPRLPAVMEKCVRHVGGTKMFYYAYRNDGVWLMDPKDNALTTGVPESHFKNCFLTYSEALPLSIKKMFAAMPSFREWSRD